MNEEQQGRLFAAFSQADTFDDAEVWRHRTGTGHQPATGAG